MPEYPGLPHITKNVWKVTAILGLSAITFQGIGVLPVFSGAAVIAPEITPYAVFAFIGWIVLYITDILSILRQYGWEVFQDLTNQMTLQAFLYLFVFVVIYLNAVIGLAAVMGAYLGINGGLPIIGFIIALLYPSFDFRMAANWVSPGFLVLATALFIFHAVGVLRSVTADAVIQGMHRGRPPQGIN